MALIEKLKNIANAIRSKTNKSEELTLEQMASEVEGIDTLQGLDFSGIYDAEQANELNKYYKNGIAYAEEIKRDWNENRTNVSNLFIYNNKILFFPNLKANTTNYTRFFALSSIQFCDIDTSHVANFTRIFYYTPLQKININTTNAVNLNEAFNGCSTLKKVILTSIENCINFTNIFFNCHLLYIVHFDKWKQGNISLAQSSELSAESIHYIIQNAVNLADGATARTLTVNANAKTNWKNSEYYEQDLAVLEQKGITIA